MTVAHAPPRTPRIGLPYESAYAKLERAHEHRRTLETTLQRFPHEQVWAVYMEPDPQVSEEYVDFRLLVSLREFNMVFRWNVLIGDVIHCLRSALDYVAWEATERTQLWKRPPNPAPVPPFPPGSPWRDIYFPVVTRPSNWPTAVNRKLWGVHPRLVTVFKRAQPFYRGKLPLFGREIDALHQLDLIDKHRGVDLAASEVVFKAVDVPPKATFIPRETWKLQSFAPVGVLRFPKNAAPKAEDVYMNLDFTFDVAFGEGTPLDGEPLLPTLAHLHDVVSVVVEAFRRRSLAIWWGSPESRQGPPQFSTEKG